jgi:cell wall-associated NlpC family hydrolase
LGEITGWTVCAALILFSSHAAEAATHKIKAGDTLWSLAKKYHTTSKAIARASGISENATLALGKNLVVPGKTPSKRTSKRSHSRPQAQSSGVILVHTACDNACLRSGPGTEHSKIAVLQAGTTAKRLARKDNWLKIALRDGRCGYVYRPLIDLGPGSTGWGAAEAGETADSSGESRLIQSALACRGARYRRGGTSRGGFDCSGFTRYVFAKYGVNLPHSSAAQSHVGTPVAKSDLRQGDLVFFQTYRRGISHVGIYIGDGRFVHASTHGRGVTVDSLSAAYYAPRYRGARRVK